MENIYGFLYKPTPRSTAKIGSLWAPGLLEAKKQAKEALTQAYPDHIGICLFRASNPKANKNYLPVPNPDDDESWLTPNQALQIEQARWAAIQK